MLNTSVKSSFVIAIIQKYVTFFIKMLRPSFAYNKDCNLGLFVTMLVEPYMKFKNLVTNSVTLSEKFYI